MHPLMPCYERSDERLDALLKKEQISSPQVLIGEIKIRSGSIIAPLSSNLVVHLVHRVILQSS